MELYGVLSLLSTVTTPLTKVVIVGIYIGIS
jgi:hypothetical protein